ncbi:Ig domain-containing protein, partial [Parasediminibacterium sp. JCM 36343]|uniref:Ig-like domain-containing protein n=1 Tax=Parasediminibacterium sp. JCM 36343 TaxID=3374279 RepID=UPI0039781F2F
TLILTIKPLSTSTTNASICAGSAYTFNGTAYSVAGTYTAHLTNAVGCDSAATLVLTVKALSTSTTNASICADGSYTFNGTTYTDAGIYTAHLTNAVGCDSASTLVLTVKALSTSTTNAAICSGGSYTFNGTSYSVAGSYTAHLVNAVGCDSAATLILTVKALSTSTTNASICAGSSYTFNGTAYSVAGTYTAHLVNAVGCDSAATLILTVKANSISTTNASICAGGKYNFNGTYYSIAGSYVSHLTNAQGCDSVATLVLTINSPTTSTTNASICAGSSYLFNGINYSMAGIYSAYLTNAAGCDSIATLVLTVNPLPTVAAISGANTACAGSTIALKDATANGVWSSSNIAVATVNANGKVSGIAVGTATISYSVTNNCGTTTVTSSIAVNNTAAPISLQPITGVSAVCKGDTTTLYNGTPGGFWSIDDTAIAHIDSLTGLAKGDSNGMANVVYAIATATGCNATVSVPLTVSCGSVISGSYGGVESKSLGDAIAKRVYNKALANFVNAVSYNSLPLVTTNRATISTMGITTPGNLAVIDLMPNKEVIGTGYKTYDVSANLADLTSFTNAQVMKGYDYVANGQTKSTTLISRTYGAVYSHTKQICDRLKGATLLEAKQITVQQLHFMQYKLQQRTGEVEYAISFSAGVQNNSNTFKIQSVWLTKNFVNVDTMYNFQIWAVDPKMATYMLNNVLNKLNALMPLQQINDSLGAPKAYITNITRDGNNLVLNINNTTASSNAYLDLVVRKNENDANTTDKIVPVTLLPNAITKVVVDLKDAYENDANLYLDGKQQDLAYMNDGNWNYSLSNSNLKPNSFTISNDGVLPQAGEFRLFRGVNINVNTPDYVSVYKLMEAGGLSKDLSGYSNLVLNASATGAGQLKIVIQKSSISNWSDQYSYTLPISTDAKDYAIRLRDFVSAASKDTLTADDVVTVTFSFLGNGNNNITSAIAGAKFTQTDYVYQQSLADKAVTVYPNPATDRFNCQFKSEINGKLVLRLMELSSGRTIITKTINAVVGQNIVPVEVGKTSAKNNQYILLLGNNDGLKYTPFKVLMK